MISKINLKKIRFTDIPRKSSISKYKEARDNFVRILSQNKDIAAIYSLGQISNIGISDLDFIIVLKNNLLNPKKCIGDIHKAMNVNPYLIIHYPLLITEKSFPDINYLFPVFDLKKNWGKDYSFNKPRNQELLNSIILNDYVSFHWPREFNRWFLQKKVKIKNSLLKYFINETLQILNIKIGKNELPVRNLLCRINSMKYPVLMLEKITGKQSVKGKILIKKIQNLRKNWFKLGNKKYSIFIELLKDAISACYEIIEQLNLYLEKNKYFKSNFKKKIFLEKEHTNIYLSSWSPEKTQKKTLDIFKRTGEIVSILPMNFYIQRKYLDDLMKYKINNLKIKPEYKNLLDKRYKLYKHEIDFLNKNKFSFKPIIKYNYLTTKPLIYKIFLWKTKIIRKMKLKLVKI